MFLLFVFIPLCKNFGKKEIHIFWAHNTGWFSQPFSSEKPFRWQKNSRGKRASSGREILNYQSTCIIGHDDVAEQITEEPEMTQVATTTPITYLSFGGSD